MRPDPRVERAERLAEAVIAGAEEVTRRVQAAVARATVEAFLGPPTVAYLADYLRRTMAVPARVVPLPASVAVSLHGWPRG